MAKLTNISCLLLCATCGASPLFSVAQQAITYDGLVKDKQLNVGLAGATIRTSSGKYTSTDNEGKFKLLASPGDSLIITSVGYDSYRVALTSTPTLIIPLVKSATQLEETVVIGYGSIKKSSLTASVSKIENKNLDQVPSARPETALQARLPGLNISQTRSTPGAAPVIRIRGIGSISAGNDPLLVVDGFPGASWSNINANDIESIEVLKDASAASIYGSRASGGVIIITTRTGKAGKPVVRANVLAGWSQPILHDDFMSSQEYYETIIKYQNREYFYVGGDPSLPLWGDSRRPAGYQVNPDILNGNDVNWQNAVTKNAPFQSYDLSVTGGTEQTKYYLSAVYKDQQGTLLNTFFKSYGMRASVDTKINERFQIGAMLNPTYQSARTSPLTMDSYNKYPPFVAIQNPDGSYPKARDYWGFNVSSQANPMGILMGTNNQGQTLSALGNIYAVYKILDGLTFKTTLNANMFYNNTDKFQASWASNTGLSSGNAADSRIITLLNENTLNYNRTFAQHHDVSLMAGASYQKATSRNINLLAVNGTFNNNIIETLNNALINPNGSNTLKSVWGMISYFGRANYAYKEKYLLSASIRTDGSSRFGPDNKWGLFPSASAAWRISKENFMLDQDLISDFKLRASLGNSGNMNIGDFAYLGLVTGGLYTVNDQTQNWLAQSSFGNNKLSWEKTNEFDLGIDLSFWTNRLSITADYYRKRTKNLLYQVSIPGTTGFTSSLSNIGEIENKGFEFDLNSKNLVGKLKWNTNFNFSINRNKVINLGGVNERMTSISYGMNWLLRVGEPMFSYYGYKHIGVFQSEEQLNNLPKLTGEKLGNPIYEDINKDGKITADDRSILGNFMPKSYWGMTNTFSYRNFDLSFTLQAVIGSKMYNFENQFYQGSVLGNMRKSLVAGSWWSPQDPGDGHTPALSLSQLSFNANSDLYIEDASFLALRNINFGYTFPTDLSSKMGIKSLRLFTSVNNAFLLTKKGFHAYNPEGYTGGEVGGISSTPGYNVGSEPISRVYTFGLNLSF